MAYVAIVVGLPCRLALDRCWAAVTKRGTIKVRGTIFKARLYGRSHGGELNYSAPHFSFSRKGHSCVLSPLFSLYLSLFFLFFFFDAVKSDTARCKRFNTWLLSALRARRLSFSGGDLWQNILFKATPISHTLIARFRNMSPVER